MKHILPLTYKPKIPDVRSGKCTQTIRPSSEKKPKKVGDMVMFHGWEGKPYRSKWDWRTPYWKITHIDLIRLKSHYLESIDPPHFEPCLEVAHSDLVNNIIAQADGFKDYEEMYKHFVKMYGKKLEEIIFDVITWNYDS